MTCKNCNKVIDPKAECISYEGTNFCTPACFNLYYDKHPVAVKKKK